MTIDEIFEGLKTAKPETFLAAVDSAHKAVKDSLFHEKTQSHNNARTQLYETIRAQVAGIAPDVFPDGGGKMKYEDMLSQLGERLKAPAKKETPTETPEQIKARLESEYEKKLSSERSKMLADSAFSEIESAAVARKLDDAYRGLFNAALRSEIQTEIDGSGKVLFKSGEKYFTRDGAHATPSQVAEDFLKKYPRLVQVSQQTPSPNGERGKTLGMSKIGAGLSELKSLGL